MRQQQIEKHKATLVFKSSDCKSGGGRIPSLEFFLHTRIKEDLRGTGQSVCQSASGDRTQAEGCFSSIQLLFRSRHRFIQ